MRRAIAGLCLAFSVFAAPVFPLAAQAQPTGSQTPATGASSGSSQTAAGGTGQASGPQPVPYSPDEFPLWLRDVRRAEVISIGAFPIALLMSSLTYQFVRYAQSGFAQSYTPALLGSAATPLTTGEKMGVLIGGAGLSLVIAAIDFGLGLGESQQ